MRRAQTREPHSRAIEEQKLPVPHRLRRSGSMREGGVGVARTSAFPKGTVRQDRFAARMTRRTARSKATPSRCLEAPCPKWLQSTLRPCPPLVASPSGSRGSARPRFEVSDIVGQACGESYRFDQVYELIWVTPGCTPSTVCANQRAQGYARLEERGLGPVLQSDRGRDR